MAVQIDQVLPFPPSPAGRKQASKSVIDMSPYEPSFGNFTQDRGCNPADEPSGDWDPAVIGHTGAYRGTMAGSGGMAPQQPGAKKSKDRASY